MYLRDLLLTVRVFDCEDQRIVQLVDGVVLVIRVEMIGSKLRTHYAHNYAFGGRACPVVCRAGPFGFGHAHTRGPLAWAESVCARLRRAPRE